MKVTCVSLNLIYNLYLDVSLDVCIKDRVRMVVQLYDVHDVHDSHCLYFILHNTKMAI